MPQVHATAIVEDGVELAEDVLVGPNCVLNGRITIGAGTKLVAGVYLNGPATIGRNNTIYPGASLGFAPQSVSYDPAHDGCGLEIGDDNVIREGVTFHRAMTDHGPTRIGSRNYFMACSHVGHDTQVGNDCQFANGALLGGHVTVADRVIFGGNASIHQFCRVGRGAMFSGLSGASVDIPPYFIVTSINISPAVNLVGLRRSGADRETIEDARWVYRTLYRSGLSMPRAMDTLRERSHRPIVVEYVEFIEASKRGICTARETERRPPVAMVR